MSLYFLAKNPDKQQKLFEEIHRYLPVKNQPVTSEILNNLKFLKACAKESMRPHPIHHNICAILLKRHDATLATTHTISKEWDSAKPYEDMPGPKPYPLIGNVWRFFPYIGDLTMDLQDQQEYLHKKFGNIVKLSALPGRENNMVMLFEPDEIEKVYRSEGPFPYRSAFRVLNYYRAFTRKDFFEGVRGTIVSQGAEWQQFRTKVNQPMLQPRSTKMYVGPIDAVAQDFINSYHTATVYIGLDTRMGCLDGRLDPDSEPQKMIEALQTMLECLYKLDVRPSPWKIISTPSWRAFVKASDFFLEVALKYITQATERLKSLPPDSDRELTILEKVLARAKNPKTAVVMALDMMIAGVDTTSSATVVALYFLAKNPDKQEKVFEEIHHYLPDKTQPVTSQTLENLKYLKGCVKESMRLRPIVIGHIRTTQKEMVLSNYRIPKGVDIFMPNFYLCQQEKYFSQADKFIPERWLKSENGEEPETKMTHPFVYMPFSFGPRMCIGRRFAEMELETLIAKIIRNFHVEYNHGEMKFQSKIICTPVSPLNYKLVERD
ncbi:probable cytochrome P450 301a1, mitochondrial [Periplaneta americana]|uniref:probable cytochrome P450 301a1, mitochondrial n=1 Tax=Periplaneta americana TaxID=6978 RepID=UPI0037E85663